jgi:acyl-coenzyme A thioesterase 13
MTTTTLPSGSSVEPNNESESTLAHVRAVWDRVRPNSPIYNLLLGTVNIVSASSTGGRIVARLEVQPIHLNSKRILHGAVSATLCDWAGGMAIAAATGLPQTGVSTDMHLSYASTAREGDTLEIEAWVTRAGRNLGFTRCEIRRGVTAEDGTKGVVVAEGSHTKYLGFGKAKTEGETGGKGHEKVGEGEEEAAS